MSFPEVWMRIWVKFYLNLSALTLKFSTKSTNKSYHHFPPCWTSTSSTTTTTTTMSVIYYLVGCKTCSKQHFKWIKRRELWIHQTCLRELSKLVKRRIPVLPMIFTMSKWTSSHKSVNWEKWKFLQICESWLRTKTDEDKLTRNVLMGVLRGSSKQS